MYKQLQQRDMASPPVNISILQKMKQDGEPIACLTAYDASFAQLVDMAGTDLVLVGDSLGMVIQGHDTTVPVTVEDIVYHTHIVRRGLGRAFLVADLPFMSYATPAQARDCMVEVPTVVALTMWKSTEKPSISFIFRVYPFIRPVGRCGGNENQIGPEPPDICERSGIKNVGANQNPDPNAIDFEYPIFGSGFNQSASLVIVRMNLIIVTNDISLAHKV